VSDWDHDEYARFRILVRHLRAHQGRMELMIEAGELEACHVAAVDALQRDVDAWLDRHGLADPPVVMEAGKTEVGDEGAGDEGAGDEHAEFTATGIR